MNAPTAPETLLNLMVVKPDQALFDRADTKLAEAQSYQITCDDMYEAACMDLQSIKALMAEVERTRTDITGPINTGLRAINALFKPHQDKLARAEAILKGAIATYRRAQEQKRLAAQAEADAEAAKQRKALEAQAAKAEKKGNGDAAETLRHAAATVVAAPAVHVAPPKVNGIVSKTRRVARVKDPIAFMRFIVTERNELAGLVEFKQGALNAQAQQLGAGLNWPGIEVEEVDQIAASAA